ncbi:MAG: amidohydrolase [Planctomycetota bacterium]
MSTPPRRNARRREEKIGEKDTSLACRARPAGEGPAVTARLFENAAVLTMDRAQPRAEAFVVRGGRFAYVGPAGGARRAAGDRAERLDLRGRTVLPGFCDAHCHQAFNTAPGGDLSECRSRAAALAEMRRLAAALPPGTWLLARAWDESLWAERAEITRRDLDSVSRARPVFAWRVDGHLLVSNSAGLAKLDLASGDPGVERDRQGRPTGRFIDAGAALAPVLERRRRQESLRARLAAAARRSAELGITMVHDIVMNAEAAEHLRTCFAGVPAGPRIVLLMPHGDLDGALAGRRWGQGDEWARLGPVKLFADGSIGARSALLAEDYRDAAGRGLEILGRRDLLAAVRKAHARGFPAAVHAIGEVAIGNALWALERAGRPRRGRDRIEHAEQITPGHIRRAARAGVVLSMQPNFLKWQHRSGLYEKRLGRGALPRMNPFARVLAAGADLVFGSDGMPAGPLFGIGEACSFPSSSVRIPVEAALRAYTSAGADHSPFAGLAGRIRPGCLADFVVLGEDPLRVPPRRLRDVPVVATCVGGRAVYGKLEV